MHALRPSTAPAGGRLKQQQKQDKQQQKPEEQQGELPEVAARKLRKSAPHAELCVSGEGEWRRLHADAPEAALWSGVYVARAGIPAVHSFLKYIPAVDPAVYPL